MTWTTDPPTRAGVYWWRQEPGGLAEPVRVAVPGVTASHMLDLSPGELVVERFGDDLALRLAGTGGEWWGPVGPPGEGDPVRAAACGADRRMHLDGFRGWWQGRYGRSAGDAAGDGDPAVFAAMAAWDAAVAAERRRCTAVVEAELPDGDPNHLTAAGLYLANALGRIAAAIRRGAGGAVVSDSGRGPATADGEPWKGV